MAQEDHEVVVQSPPKAAAGTEGDTRLRKGVWRVDELGAFDGHLWTSKWVAASVRLKVTLKA